MNFDSVYVLYEYIKNVTDGEEVNKGCNIALGLLRIILQDVALLDLRKRRDAAKKKATYLHPSRLQAGGELFAVFCSKVA
jgi:hypothetical protein